MQGRESITPPDRGDDSQQWFPGHEYYRRKHVKVRLFPRYFSAQYYEPRFIRLSMRVGQPRPSCIFGQYEDEKAAVVAKAQASIPIIILNHEAIQLSPSAELA